MWKKSAQSARRTQAVAETFAKQLHPGDIVCLYGELGAGKTTFVQGMARALGVKKRIISPTFVIVRSYSNKDNMLHFYHVDLYRITREQDVQATGLLEIMSDTRAIIAIEWSERMGSLLPKKRWEVTLSHAGDNQREIKITKLPTA